MTTNKTMKAAELGDRITFRRGSLTQTGVITGFWHTKTLDWGYRVLVDEDGGEIDVPRRLQIDGESAPWTVEESARAQDRLFTLLAARVPGGSKPGNANPRSLFWRGPAEGALVSLRVIHCIETGEPLIRVTTHTPYNRAAHVQVPAASREFRSADEALEYLRDRLGSLDICPGCGEPSHATESDDDGYHAGCRTKGGAL